MFRCSTGQNPISNCLRIMRIPTFEMLTFLLCDYIYDIADRMAVQLRYNDADWRTWYMDGLMGRRGSSISYYSNYYPHLVGDVTVGVRRVWTCRCLARNDCPAPLLFNRSSPPLRLNCIPYGKENNIMLYQ